MTLEAIIFDVDGVLLDSKRANAVYYRHFLARHGYPPVSDDELEYGHSHTLWESIAYLTRAPEAEVQALWEAARSLDGYPFELAAVPHDCLETLAQLRAAGYWLGIVSSRVREGIDQFLDVSSLHGRFSAVVGYEDAPRAKPNPDPLLVACERLRVAAGTAVYVGDAPGDFACARAAGTRFIAFGGAVPEAPYTVTCFSELPSMLRELGW